MVDVNDFRSDLVGKDPKLSVGYWVLERVPYMFEDGYDYSVWRHRLAEGLGVDACDLVVTGSAATGFSLNPYKALKLFDTDSDIDVAVISPYHFDVAWRYLRSLGSAMYALTRTEQEAVRDHRTRLIYWGTVATDRLLQRLPFGPEWLKTVADVSGESPVNGRDVNLRLYRDFQALRAYQTDGFRKLRESVLS